MLIGCSRPSEDRPQLAASSSNSADPDGVVATVNGKPILESVVCREMVRRGGDFLGAFADPSNKEALVDELVQLEVFAQEAERSGYDHDSEMVAIWRRMLGEKAWADRVGRSLQDITVSREDTEAYFAAHRQEYAEVERRRGQLIFVKLPANPSAEQSAATREQARVLAQKAASLDEAQFATLASERSEDSATRLRGGDLGWVPKGASIYRYDEKVISALFALGKEGDTSDPIETGRGFYVLRLTAQAGGTVPELAAVEDRLRREMLAARRREARERAYEEARRDYTISVDHELVAKIGPATLVADGSQPPSFPVDSVNVVPKASPGFQ